LASTTGNINVGTNAGTNAGTSTLTANTGGTGNVTITERDAVTLGASSAGGNFFIGTAGSLNVVGNISATDILLQTTLSPFVTFTPTGTLNLTGNVTVNACPGLVFIGTGGTVNAANDVTLNTCALINPNNLIGTVTLNVCPDCPPGPFNP